MVKHHLKSYLSLMFLYLLIGPLLGGLVFFFPMTDFYEFFLRPQIYGPKFVKGIALIVPLSYAAGLIPAFLAGTINWLVLLTLFYKNKNSYLIQATVTAVIYSVLITIIYSFNIVVLVLSVLSIYTCALVTNKKAIVLLSKT